MKIAVFSDCHLGFDEKGERSEESYSNLAQALGVSIEENADAVLLAGDLFDEPVPSHAALYRAVECFSRAKKTPSSAEVFVEKKGETKRVFSGSLPVITIHGNHEHRGKDVKGALDVLGLSGLLVYFHAGIASVKKGDEEVFIHGLGAVPEKKALEALRLWNPRPRSGAGNILMLHQAFREFLAVDDEMVATLSLDDLPKGFDLVVDGHLHWRNEQDLGKTIFLLPGSTIATSIKRLESEKPKGVYFYDTASGKLSFKALPVQRKMFYHKIVFNEADAETVLEKCAEAVSSDLSSGHELKPLVRLNLKGTLKKGLSPSDIDLKEFTDSFGENALLSVSKNFSSQGFRKKISELRELQESRLSMASMGFELLEKNLGETDFGDSIDVKELFELLAEKEIDKALALVSKN